MLTSSEPVIAIRADGIGKQYRVGKTVDAKATYRSLRDDLAGFMRPAARSEGAKENQTFWALRNVSFEIAIGERVGIIGRNGAGKSTLLKMLSRITSPSVGRAEIRGRVGALLEVGTGFHPELTGRDNISLNGAILGMSRSAIRGQMDEIIEFSGVERFIDTPVKRYSTGMYLRLAFAVAAHLEPDVLLIDEVLAVGDAEFQKKCLGRMEHMSTSGRTLLFVSHSMPAVLRLCNRVILLDGGQVLADGPPEQVIRAYLDTGYGTTAERTWSGPDAPGDDFVRLQAVRVRSHRGGVAEDIDIERSLTIEVEYWQTAVSPRVQPSVNIHIINEHGITVFVTGDFSNRAWQQSQRRRGLIRATCHIPGNLLSEGRFFVLAAITTFSPPLAHVEERDVVAFQVVDRSQGDGARGDLVLDFPGVVRPLLDWDIQIVQSDVSSSGGAPVENKFVSKS